MVLTNLTADLAITQLLFIGIFLDQARFQVGVKFYSRRLLESV